MAEETRHQYASSCTNVRETIDVLKKHRERGGKMQWITCTFHALVGRRPGEVQPTKSRSWSMPAPTPCTSRAWRPTSLCGFTNDISAADSADARAKEPNLELLAQALDWPKRTACPPGSVHTARAHPGLREGRAGRRLLPEDVPPPQLSHGQSAPRFELLPGSGGSGRRSCRRSRSRGLPSR